MSMEESIKTINEIFFEQIKDIEKTHVWFELNYEDTKKLKQAIETILTAMDIIEERDKIIDLMANEIFIEHNPHFNTVEDVKKYFKERCK